MKDKSSRITVFTGILLLFFFIILIIMLFIFEVKGDWLGFWGGISGSIVGLISSSIFLNLQFQEERKQNKSNKVNDNFFNMLDRQNSLINDYRNEELFQKIISDLNDRLKAGLIEAGQKYINENKIEIDKELKKLKLEYQNFFRDHFSKLSDSHKERLNKGRYSFFPTPITEEENLYNKMWEIRNQMLLINAFINSRYRTVSAAYELDKIIEKARTLNIYVPSQLLKKMAKIRKYEVKNPRMLNTNSKKSIMEDTFNDYENLDNYVNVIYNSLKYINDNVKVEDEVNFYILFFKAEIKKTEMTILFYIVRYTEKGKKLKNIIDSLVGIDNFFDSLIADELI